MISHFGILVKRDLCCSQMPRSTLANRQETLQNLLIALRTEMGVRQVDLAERLGRPQSFVSKYESGERRLDIIEVHAVCGRSRCLFCRLRRAVRGALK